MEPSSPSSTAPKQGDELHGPPYIPTLTEYGPDHESTTGAHASQPNPYKRPWADSDPYPDLEWNHPVELGDPPPQIPALPYLPKEFGQAQESQVEQPKPNKRPWKNPNSYLDLNYWTALGDPPQLRPVAPKEFGQVEHVQQPHPEPLTDPFFDWINLAELLRPSRLASSPKDVGLAQWGVPLSGDASNPGLTTEHGSGHNLMAAPHQPLPYSQLPTTEFDKDHNVNLPSAEAGLPTVPKHDSAESSKKPENEAAPAPPPAIPELTDPGLQSDRQSLSTDSQPEDLLAATIAEKGKAKESRHISGTTRDVGKVAQRDSELEPAEVRD